MPKIKPKLPSPYGINVPSNVTKPPGYGGEWVPAGGGKPAQYPWYLKPIPVNTRDIRAELVGYLNKNEPKVARWLYSTWNAEASAIKFQEIRNALRDKEIPRGWIENWRADYNRFVKDVLDPHWKAAIAHSGAISAADIGKYAGAASPFGFTPTGKEITAWIADRGGELAVNLTELQHDALRILLRHYTVEDPVGPIELGRIIRANIGLTPKQAQAVTTYRKKLYDSGLDRNKVEHKIGDYVSMLNRQRALRIARTEIAFAFNYGQFEAFRQAQTEGWFNGPLVKQWETAEDERVCPFCGPLHETEIGFTDTFPGLTLKLPTIYTPPAHPMCRCTVSYKVLEDLHKPKPYKPKPKEPKPEKLPTPAKPPKEPKPKPEPKKPPGYHKPLDSSGKVGSTSKSWNESQTFWRKPEHLDPTDYTETSGATKKRIAQEIAARLDKNDPDIQKLLSVYKGKDSYRMPDPLEEMCAELVHDWAVTAADNYPWSLALQLAAKEEFGLTDAWIGWTGSGMTQAHENMKEVGAGLRKFLRAQYDNTQDFFKKRGITEVLLTRGAGWGDSQLPQWMKGLPDTAWTDHAVRIPHMQTQPMNSWSVTGSMAHRFTSTYSTGEYKVIAGARVPVERIIGTCTSGVGCKSESEMVVLGGIDEVVGCIWKQGWNSTVKDTQVYSNLSKAWKTPKTKAGARVVAIDSYLENADWTKQSYDLEPKDPKSLKAFLKASGISIAAFKQLPVYLLNVDTLGWLKKL